jgi:GNAT superfamily N-acetyltransferase
MSDLNLSLRPYDHRDHPACRALWVELTDHHRRIYDDPSIGGDDPGAAFDDYLANPARVESWVAEQDRLIVGLTGLFELDGHGEVEPVIVTGRLRRHGVGRLLLDHAIDEGRRRGYAYMTIQPVARNTTAITAFRAIGFHAVGHIQLTMDLQPRSTKWKPGLQIRDAEFGW